MHAGVVGVLEGAVDDGMVGRVSVLCCYCGLVKTKSVLGYRSEYVREVAKAPRLSLCGHAPRMTSLSFRPRSIKQPGITLQASGCAATRVHA